MFEILLRLFSVFRNESHEHSTDCFCAHFQSFLKSLCNGSPKSSRPAASACRSTNATAAGYTTCCTNHPSECLISVCESMADSKWNTCGFIFNTSSTHPTANVECSRFPTTISFSPLVVNTFKCSI